MADPDLVSLITSFALVPPASVPAILDCVLASSPSLSPSRLFASLLDAFPAVLQDFLKEESLNFDSTRTKLVSFVKAQFHLVKNKDICHDGVQMFIWRVVVPLIKTTNPNNKDLLDEVDEMLYELLFSCQGWKLIEEAFVPFCLRSVDIHIGGINSGKELAISRLSKKLSIPSEKCWLNDSQSLPLLSACHILSSLLDASISKINQYEGLGILDKFVLAKGFSFKLIWDLTVMAIDMLTECLEHRVCAIRLLLPALFRAFTVLHSFEVEINGLPRFLSRHCFSRRIWKSCRSLFSSGQLERLDAYKVLSLYFSFPFGVKGCQGSSSEPFDMASKEEFWEEIQRGLVDKDATTRKMALYVLKVSLENHHVFVNCEDSQVHVYENGFTSTSNGNPLDSVVTRREKWAKKEAESLGVTEIHPFYGDWTGPQRWKTFLLLYEMLEEYGTHLVEAAWTHQVHVLFQSGPLSKNTDHINGDSCQSQMETIEGMLCWLTVLWERGFIHENPQVRCLIMQSFLSLDWDAFGNYAKLVPKKFILGPLVRGLNDVVHHKDFGLKGVYTSRTIQNATKFFHQSCNHFSKSARIGYLCSLVSIVRHESFGRAGLMTLAFCISSAACESNNSDGVEGLCCTSSGTEICQVDLAQETFASCKPSDLLEALGIIVEKSKQHFNPKYRLEVCEQVVSAANSVIDASELPFDVLLHFISTIPNEFTDINGPLRRKVQEWILQCNKSGDIHSHDTETGILKNLCDFPSAFVKCHLSSHSSFSFDDDDLNLWVSKVDRWARLFFLTVTRVHHIEPFLKFLKNYGANICLPSANVDWIPVKFILIIMRVMDELLKVTCHKDPKGNCEGGAVGVSSQSFQQAMLIAHENFKHVFLSFCEELIQFAGSSSEIFWSASLVEDMNLPTSLKGRLGGPSQRRLSLTASTAVLQAIVSMKAVAGLFSWLTQIQRAYNESLFTFLWNFSKMVILSSPHNSEIGAEIHLAAYEALVSVLRALSSSLSPSAFLHIRSDNTSAYPNKSFTPLLDDYLYSFLKSINNLLADGFLTRSRRAVLINWKWCCLDALLSIPYSASGFEGLNSSSCDLFSDSCLQSAFLDVVDSLENVGEASALPMLRSVRLILGLFAVGGTNRLLTSFGLRSSEIMEQLVHSSWILHVSCNKRRVAPIAALLSSILHPTVFSDPRMHETHDGRKGPLKWFIEQLLDQGTRSPRTIRLAACHLTGLWLSHPRILKYYMEDLKLLSLHGSVAFDEDFEAELLESCEAKAEVFMLARSPYSEISEAYINTEMYARVSVAVLFYQLAAMAGKGQGPVVDDNAIAARCYGKMFLLELLNHTVDDKDLAKELYKKYSAVHRRKVRAWQLICVLSCYVESDIVQQVTSILHTCLNRGNLPGVRQYLEMFSIQIYLKFPALITEQLVPILRDYNMRPQVLSSYVFVAANVIIHAVDAPLQLAYCNELLPPIVPFLTSHHHSLRGFTQVLVHHVLSKMAHIYPETSDTMTLATRCFEDLKCYLTENHDCARLRASMECFFSSFDPKTAATPAGIFVARDEASDFECAPVALMEQVVTFLNDVREDLRYTMAKDNMIIKNESLNINGGGGKVEVLGEITADGTLSDVRKDLVIDFQKKITLNKYDSQLNSNLNGFSGKFEFRSSLSEMEKEDLLLSSYSRSRFEDMKKLRDSRQQIILMASLLDRIPNLAGLARTCEIFKATGLAVADASIIEDKQFQLISVTAEKWVPIIEVPVSSMKAFLEKKRREGFSIVGLEQTANSVTLDLYSFPTKTVLVLGREKEGIPVDIIHGLDACVEIPQLGIIRSLNVHVSGAIALWEYTRQQRCNKST